MVRKAVALESLCRHDSPFGTRESADRRTGGCVDITKEPDIAVDEPVVDAELGSHDAEASGTVALEVIEAADGGEVRAVVTTDDEREPDAQQPDEGSSPRRSRSVLMGLAAFGVYLVASVLAFAAPVITALDTRCVGLCGMDARLYVWSFRWMQYALANGQDPFYTDLLWTPFGMNLTWVTTLPGPAFLMNPVTKSFGPLVTENILLIAAPALAAWAAYLVCKFVTGRFWPSLAGGFVFGFSTYIVQHERSHVNLLLIFFVPLALYLALRRTHGKLHPAIYVPLLALLLVGQFSVSTELFTTLTFFGGLTFLGALAFGPKEKRKPVFTTMLWTGLSYLLALVAVSPFLIDAFQNQPPGAIRELQRNSTDMLSIIIPRPTLQFGGSTFASFTEDWTASPQDDTAYVGIALLLMLALFAWEGRKSRTTWLLLGAVALPLALSFGPTLYFAGTPTVPGPGWITEHIPLVQHALPERYPAYAFLAMGVVAAIWIARSSGKGVILRFALVGLGVLMLVRDGDEVHYHGTYKVPEFFSEGTFRDYIEPGATILAIPYEIGDELAWQAAADMEFRLAQAYTGPLRPAGALTIGRIRTQPGPKLPAQERLVRFVIQGSVQAIVVSTPIPNDIRVLMESLTHSPGIEVDGVTVYRIPPGGPFNSAGRQLDPSAVAPPDTGGGIISLSA